MNMRNYGKVGIVLLSLVLFFFGCANWAVVPDRDFKSSSDLSLIFGRLEVSYLGELAQFDVLILKKMDMQKSYEIRFDGLTRYFFAALPPGDYIIIGASNLRETSAYRGKMWIPADVNIIFHVHSDNATYIGTIQVNATNKINERISYKCLPGDAEAFAWGLSWGLGSPKSPPKDKWITEAEYNNLSASSKNRCEKIDTSYKEGIVNWQVKDDFNEAKKVFAALYPNHKEPIDKIVDIPIKRPGVPRVIWTIPEFIR